MRRLSRVRLLAHEKFRHGIWTSIQPVSLVARTNRLSHLNFGLNFEAYRYQQVYSLERKSIAVQMLISRSLITASKELYLTGPVLLFFLIHHVKVI